MDDPKTLYVYKFSDLSPLMRQLEALKTIGDLEHQALSLLMHPQKEYKLTPKSGRDNEMSDYQKQM